MDPRDALPEIELNADTIIRELLQDDSRLLLLGEPGTGKSTLARRIGEALGKAGRDCHCIGADPGSPAFGIPGAVSLGRWNGEGWGTIAFEAVCTLDAGRFRMPLVSALRRLARHLSPAPLIVDSPGITRGVTGAELLFGVSEALEVDAIILLARKGKDIPLLRELRAIAAEVFTAAAGPEARRESKRHLARRRTEMWNVWLEGAEEREFNADEVELVGTAPPLNASDAWRGRQAALLDREHRTLGMGEVASLAAGRLRIKMPPLRKSAQAGKILLVRDAKRDENGWLRTSRISPPSDVRYAPPPDMISPPAYAHVIGPRPVAHAGMATATLVNGVFGDPLLHLRMRRQKRSLLFDLGEASWLPARIAHQVTDVFISHAHIDHIGGFLWLLRSRIGYFPACRVHGPPGLAEKIGNAANAILWDRIEDRGPRFEIAELNGETVTLFRVEAGKPRLERVATRKVEDGILLGEADFMVRAAVLDHNTPVLAFAFEPKMRINVRKERLKSLGWPPGPWLGELKRAIYREEREALVQLPDGRRLEAGGLAGELFIITPGEKLVYAADLADTPDNRERLSALAKGAHSFFCEASFAEEDAELARRNQHLTARACGEIAKAAGVERLIPFHFSKRYERDPEVLYREIRAAFPGAVTPKFFE